MTSNVFLVGYFFEKKLDKGMKSVYTLFPVFIIEGYAGVAQLVEQLTCNQQVGGSIPLTSLCFLRFVDGRDASLQRFRKYMGRYPSGQRGRAVNPLAMPSEVRILLSPLYSCGCSSVGRASAFQVGGRGFESRHPLFRFKHPLRNW